MRHENDVTSEFKCKFYKHLGSPNLATITKFDEIIEICCCTQLLAFQPIRKVIQVHRESTHSSAMHGRIHSPVCTSMPGATSGGTCLLLLWTGGCKHGHLHPLQAQKIINPSLSMQAARNRCEPPGLLMWNLLVPSTITVCKSAGEKGRFRPVHLKLCRDD